MHPIVITGPSTEANIISLNLDLWKQEGLGRESEDDLSGHITRDHGAAAAAGKVGFSPGVPSSPRVVPPLIAD